jgi:hypothetical protein
MQTFTGYEYLLIDVCNNNPFDGDKLTFQKRIDWATEHMDQLSQIAVDHNWKKKPLFLKAMQAVHKAQKGIPTGHLVGFDAVNSGMQLMAAMTGCVSGADATGLVDPNRRADAYSECTLLMAQILGRHIPGERAKVKQALMTALYGSKAEPRALFGEGTPELNAFNLAMYQLSPGACMLLQALLDSWQPYALVHEWDLPDGYHARVKVMQKVEDCRIEVDELGHSTFTYQYYINEGEASGVKNAANVIHSIDAYVLRCMIRRCNYDIELVEMAQDLIIADLLQEVTKITCNLKTLTEPVARYMALYFNSGMVDPVILEHLTPADITCLPSRYLKKLNSILKSMLVHRPFEVVTIHDQFSAHPNNLNHVRSHYRDILADLAESTVLDDILSQLHSVKGGTYQKLTPDLGAKIRQSNYALC